MSESYKKKPPAITLAQLERLYDPVNGLPEGVSVATATLPWTDEGIEAAIQIGRKVRARCMKEFPEKFPKKGKIKNEQPE